MNTRISNGLPMQGTNVVAADAIGKMAGVSGKDVARVLVAIHAVAAASGLAVHQVVDYPSIPTEAADAERYDATDDFVYKAIHRLQKTDLRFLANDLRLHSRFGAKRGNVIPMARPVFATRPLATVGE